MITKNRTVAAAFSLILLFAIALSFPGVRAAASDFLGVFRVQKFTAISVSPQQLAVLEQVAEQGISPGELEIIEEPGELTPVDSVAAAESQTGLGSVLTLPTLGTPDEIYISGGGSGRLTIDLEGARAIVSAAGADASLLSDNLDGADVFVAVFAGVQQTWDDGTILMQTASPRVEYPDDLDPVLLGEALLQVLGVEPVAAKRLARSIDWTSTLLLPVPQTLGTFTEVTINGASGLAIRSLDGGMNGLVWQADGMVYALSSAGSVADLVDLAHSLD